jgi:hypothetical protein
MALKTLQRVNTASKNRWPLLLLVLNLAVISLIVILFLNRSYPMVGHDYAYSIPQMLDTTLHFRANGLSIQWYTPSFGGGVPAFPDPNNSQFSLLEMLSLLVQPWQAVMVSVVIFIFVGGIASYYFFNRVLRLHWISSLLGTVFFTATGFYMERIACGHIFYQTFLLLPILLITFLDLSLSWRMAGLLFGLVMALMVHEASFFLIVVMGLSVLIILPLVYIYKPDTFSWKRFFYVAATGLIVSLLLSASKLSAVYSLMRFFPRQAEDFYPNTSILKGLLGIGSQLLGTMSFAPIFWLVRLDPRLLQNYFMWVTGSSYGYWEYDMSMTPLVFGIIITGVYDFVRKPKKHAKWFTSDKKWIAWILLILFVWLTIEFTLAKGLIYPRLQQLPILSSLHVNPRFAAAFLFPFAICAAIIYDKQSTGWSTRKSMLTFLLMNLAALLTLGINFMIPNDLQNRAYDITSAQTIYDAIQSGENMTVTGIVTDVDNTQALLLHESNLQPYDPIFGYLLEDFHPEIHTGSIWDISDGYYNMTNPSGYVFPEINGTRPFERVHVNDKIKLEAFASHRQPDWKIPVYQQVLDWASGLTFVAAVIILSAFGFQRLRGKRAVKKGN